MDKKEIICYLLAILVGVGVFLLGLFNPGKWPREMAVFVIKFWQWLKKPLSKETAEALEKWRFRIGQ